VTHRPGGTGASSLPEPRTSEGRAGLAAILAGPDRALIALDFDGTLSPIVSEPGAARAHPAAVPALTSLSRVVGTLAVITGRPAARAVELGELGRVPGLIVLGHYGWERWQNGTLESPPAPPGVAAARARLPELLAAVGAPDGTGIEGKHLAVAVHTRRTADPAGTLERLAGPMAELAAEHGLQFQPGRMVIELRPAGTDKGSTLTRLTAERAAHAVMFAGDDVGDLPAFRAVRDLRDAGLPGLTVCSASAEVDALATEADLVVDGPDGITALLTSLAEVVGS
jgi:trehalose 6-phosphate phosphatase